MSDQQGVLSKLALIFVAFLILVSVALGLPVDSSIKFNSTCNVKTVFVNGSGSMIEISLSVNLTHVKMPVHHGGCFNLVSASQSGRLYRLICAEFGEVVSSNSCISFNKAPMKDLCHYGVEKLDFNKTSEDGLLLLIVTLKRLDSICGRRLKLAYESMGLSKDEACDFQCTVTTPSNNNSLPGTSPVSTPSQSVPTEAPSNNNSLPGTSPVSTPSQSVPTEASSSSGPSESTQPNSVPSGGESQTTNKSIDIPLTVGLTLLVVVILVASLFVMYKYKTCCFKQSQWPQRSTGGQSQLSLV